MPTANSDIRLVLEEGLCAYFNTKKVTGSALLNCVFYAGHGESKIEGALVGIITATNKGGKLAYAGNFDLDVEFSLVASVDDAGMAVLSPLERSMIAFLAPENITEVLEFLNAFPDLGVSCYETDGTGTKEGRDPETREQGAKFTHRFNAHLR